MTQKTVHTAGAVLLMWLALAAVSLAREAPDSNAIPDRPEKLTFKPLDYEPPSPADYRVVLTNGPVAYIVPDRELPLVNIAIYIRGGSYLEAIGHESLAETTGHLLTRGGTAGMTADELEERLAFLAAHLSSGIGGTQGSVRLNLLSKDLDEGFSILREVLTQPAFQEDKLALWKQQLLQAIKQRNDESADIESREASFLAYGEDFWVNRLPTAASVNSLQRDQLQAFHHQWIWPGNFVVAVNGDFERDAMISKLETLFADWPFHGSIAPPVPHEYHFGKPGLYVVDKDVNQGRVTIMLPGVMRDSPDFFPAIVMNEILGGGGFTSRIVSRVRSDEGLAYAAGSVFPGGVYYPLAFRAGFQSKSRTVAYATSLVLEEMRRLTKEPVGAEELKTAKSSFIETFPRAFASKSQIANTFAQDEITGRYAKNPEYWKEYRDHIRAVTLDDVRRVAEKYLVPSKVIILVVGQEKEILLGHPGHPVKLEDLAKGPLRDLPLRDPMTLKPMTR